MCAILFGCNRFHDYIFGVKTIVETDNKLLVGIFQKPLHKLSPRLQRMSMMLLRYDLEVVYKPGKELYIPDALSRAPLTDTPPSENDEHEIMSVISQMPVTNEKLIELREKTAEDPVLAVVCELVLQGWPDDKNRVPHVARPFHTFRDEITYCNGLLFRQSQIIIPSAMQAEMLAKLHASYQGIVKLKQRA